MHVAQSERRSETNALEQGIVSGKVSTEAVGSTYRPHVSSSARYKHCMLRLACVAADDLSRDASPSMQLYSHAVPCSNESLDARSASASQRLIV